MTIDSTEASTQNPAPEGQEPGRPAGWENVTIDLPNISSTVTYIIMGITILVYLLQEASQYFLGNDWPMLLGFKYNPLIVQGQFWRLITPVLLHGSIIHIAFNMYALFSLGRGLERYFGHGRFLILYLLGGFAGNVFSFMFSPNPSLGSSTAVFGLLAAEGVFIYQNRRYFGNRSKVAIREIILIAGVNLAIGLSTNGIDNWGHLGGLAGGLLYTWLAGPIWYVEGAFPALSIKDRRPAADTVKAAMLVCTVFLALVAVRLAFWPAS